MSTDPKPQFAISAGVEWMSGEIQRLTAALSTANANHEHFEREWYLRGDTLERLTSELATAQGVLATRNVNLARLATEKDAAVGDVKRLGAAITAYVDARKAGLGVTAVHWYALQMIADEFQDDVSKMTWTCSECDMRGRPAHADTCVNCGAARPAPDVSGSNSTTEKT